MFGAAGNTRKGGIPNMKLRGVTDMAEFIQKNNTVEKGLTFNYDGSLIDFKKPKIQRELEEKLEYEVGNESIIHDAFGRKGKQKAAASQGFNARRMSTIGQQDQQQNLQTEQTAAGAKGET